MHERLDKGIFLGIVGNILFILFGFICYLFYVSYEYKSLLSKVLEALAYIAEFSGFIILIYAGWLMFSAVRMRSWLKFGFSAYIVLEAVMMFLEINTTSFSILCPLLTRACNYSFRTLRRCVLFFHTA